MTLFQPHAPRPVRYEITLAPIQSALVSFAALTSPLEIYEDEAWVGETAEALTDAQRQHNRLVFEAFGDAVVPEREYPDVPAYLAALAGTPPARLRERVLAGSAHADAWQARAAIDAELREQALSLLEDPPALRELIVGHLSELWSQFYAAAWQRRLSQLQGFQLFLQQREFPTTSAGDFLRGLLNREVPDWIAAQLGDVRQIKVVLQPHVRLFAARFGSPDTLWLFVRPSPENLAVRSAPIKRAELVRPFAALADESRLHILELLAQHGALPTQEIIARLDQSQPNVSRHVKQLVSAGFVDELRGEGANKRYRINTWQIDRLFWLLRQLLTPANAQKLADATRASQPAALRRFLDPQGRVMQFPAKREDRMLVLRYLASKFEAGREYTEPEVNAIINQWHSYQDHASLRRELFDSRLLDRTIDGARYWLASKGAEE
jgi:hypothetical protein